MKVTQEKLPSSQIGLEIEIPAELSKKTYEKVIQDLSRTANIPGFRKGKVPRKILLQRMGILRIKATAVEDLIQDSLNAALKQEEIKAIGQFELRSSFDELVTKFQPGEPLTFAAAVDVTPEVKLGDYSNLSLKAEEVEYDPTQVDKFLEERRVEKANLIPVEGRPAQKGDVAIVDYVGRFAEGEGAEIPGAQGNDFEVELAEEKFIEDFINGIVGMNPGETKEVTVQFPENYGRQDLAGKTALFNITLQEIKEKELPELNDDFAQEVSEFETLAELRSSLEAKFQGKAEQETTANKEQAVVQELLQHVEIDLPETMIEREVEQLLTQTAMQLEQYGMDVKTMFTPETMPHLKERSRPEAITRIKQSLALEEIAQRESLQVEPEALETKIKELAGQLSGRNIDPVRLREFVTADLLKDKAIKWLTGRATIELVPKGSLKPAESEDLDAEETSTDVEAEAATVASAEVASK